MTSAAPLSRDELLELFEDLSHTLVSRKRTPAQAHDA